MAPSGPRSAATRRPAWIAMVAVVMVLTSGCLALSDAGSDDEVDSSRPAKGEVPAVPALVVLDASGSMRADDAPGVRFDAAQEAVSALVNVLPAGHQIGLDVYGTSTGSGDDEEAKGCVDIRTAVPFGELDKAAFAAEVDKLKPRGYTPIGAALTRAADELPKDGARAIVLISDGIDTCAPPDPCDVAKDLHASSPDLVVHTVGFKVADDESAAQQLACIADATGGLNLDASNGQLLRTRLAAVFNPGLAEESIQPTGYRGLEPGMDIEQARKAAPKIGDIAPKGQVVIRYVDCDVVFEDGVLTEIRSASKDVQTLDGVGVGDDIASAEKIYGTAGTFSPSESNTVTYPADPVAGTGYKITYQPSGAAGQVAGKITTVTLCACMPGDGMKLSQVEVIDPAEIPANSIAGGTAGTLTALHPTLGRIYLAINVELGSGAVVALDGQGNRIWTSGWIQLSEFSIEFADPVTDSSGNIFIRFNPGRYFGTVVIRATPDGVDEIEQSRRDDTGYASDFYGTDLIGPEADGLYVIRSHENDCTPSCAGGSIADIDLHWDGKRYAPR